MSSVVAEKRTSDFTKNLADGKTLPPETAGGESVRKWLLVSTVKGNRKELLTQRGVLAQLDVVALEALLRPPPVVSPFDDDVDFLVAVLTDVSAEDPAAAVAAHRVAAVQGASPHVPYAVCEHLRPSVQVSGERIVRWDPVRFPERVASIHIDAQHFAQQRTPE